MTWSFRWCRRPLIRVCFRVTWFIDRRVKTRPTLSKRVTVMSFVLSFRLMKPSIRLSGKFSVSKNGRFLRIRFVGDQLGNSRFGTRWTVFVLRRQSVPFRRGKN